MSKAHRCLNEQTQKGKLRVTPVLQQWNVQEKSKTEDHH